MRPLHYCLGPPLVQLEYSLPVFSGWGELINVPKTFMILIESAGPPLVTPLSSFSILHLRPGRCQRRLLHLPWSGPVISWSIWLVQFSSWVSNGCPRFQTLPGDDILFGKVDTGPAPKLQPLGGSCLGSIIWQVPERPPTFKAYVPITSHGGVGGSWENSATKNLFLCGCGCLF